MRRIALLYALVVAALALSTSAASAGFDQEIDTKGGIVWFEEFGDVVGAKDQRKDKLGVSATISWNDKDGDNHTHFVADTDGAGGPALGTRERFSIPEGTRVALTMCYLKNHVGIWKCSDPQSAMA